MKKVFGAIAFVMFFLMIGTVGSMENDHVPLLEGTIRAFVYMALWVVSTYCAGGFDQERREPGEVQRKDADPRSGRSGRKGAGPSGRR